MRTILFRGKTINDHGMLPAGSWITGGYYMDDCYGGCPQGRHYILTWNSGGPGGFMDRCEVERESVGQYTGIKDRNGKWIYEGDAMYASGNLSEDWEEFIGFIEWDADDARFEVVTLHGRFEYIPDGCHVKGNKFDTQVLLGGTSDVG